MVLTFCAARCIRPSTYVPQKSRRDGFICMWKPIQLCCYLCPLLTFTQGPFPALGIRSVSRHFITMHRRSTKETEGSSCPSQCRNGNAASDRQAGKVMAFALSTC